MVSQSLSWASMAGSASGRAVFMAFSLGGLRLAFGSEQARGGAWLSAWCW
jgi:hypothetical protein